MQKRPSQPPPKNSYMAGGNSNADVQRMTDGVIGARVGGTAARRTMNWRITIVIPASGVAVAAEGNSGRGPPYS